MAVAGGSTSARIPGSGDVRLSMNVVMLCHIVQKFEDTWRTVLREHRFLLHYELLEHFEVLRRCISRIQPDVTAGSRIR